MSEERKTHVWLWIAALLIGLPVLYVASFGPACFLVDRQILRMSVFSLGFKPCLDIVLHGPELVKNVLWSWAEICGGEDTLWYFLEELILGHIGSP